MERMTFRWDVESGWSAPLGLLDSPDTLVLVFGDSTAIDGSTALSELVKAYPTSCITGCSTSGEIFEDTLSDQSLTVLATRFATTGVTLAATPVAGPADSFAAGARLARQLFGEPGADGTSPNVSRDDSGAPDDVVRAVFVLSDGLDVSGSLLVDGLVASVGPSVAISGGLAGDGSRFERTWVLVDGVPHTGYVVGVALCGPDLRVGFGSRGGWEIFGPERRVTRSSGTVLYELDGQPALELYKEYLGARATELPASALLYPLAIRSAGRRQVVRTVLAVDDAEQSMTFAGDIPEGSHARLMRANVDRLVEGAYDAAVAARTEDGSGPVLAIAVSCVGRRLLLGRRTEDELEAVVSALGPDVELAGFYSYGEISPGDDGVAALHNQTMTLTTVSERTPEIAAAG